MVWKTSINVTSVGDTAKFGSVDINKIAQLLNGVADVDTVTINSPFTVQNGKLIVSTITNTGTITLPTATTTLVGRNTTDTLTNKTLTSPAITTPTITSSGGAITLPAGPDTLVGRATTDTLTNKTIDGSLNTIISLPANTTAVYDSFPATYTMTVDNQLSPNSLWRMKYHGSNPQNGAQLGVCGVRAPSSPTGGFSRVMFEYPYTSTNTSPTLTSASLVLTESTYYGDFDVTFSVRTVAQKRTSPNAWETAWFMWHFNEANGNNFHHYYLALKSNGTLEVGRKDNTVQADEQFFLSTSATYSYTVNTWNLVRVKSVSNVINVWIDGVQKITDLTDNGAGGAQGGAPNTPAVPSAAMYSGKFGFYNEDAEVEFSPLTITTLGGATAAAPVTAPYITIATDTALTNERMLAVGSNKLSLTDSGAGGNITLDVVSANLDVTRVLSRSVATQDVVSTAAETSIFSYSVPGGTLSTNKMLRLALICDYLNNSGTTKTITLKVKYGATTLYQDVTASIASNSARSAVQLNIFLGANNATNAQVLGGWASVSDPGGANTGIGDFADDEIIVNSPIGGSAAEDSTATKTLDVTITHSASDALTSFRRHIGVLELV